MALVVSVDHIAEEDLEGEVDEDIARFSAYFQSLGNDPMSGFEKAAIKTYLHWKTHGEPSPAETTADTEGAHGEEAAG